MLWDVIMAVLGIPNQSVLLGVLFWLSVLLGFLLLWAEPVKSEEQPDPNTALARLGVTTTETQD